MNSYIQRAILPCGLVVLISLICAGFYGWQPNRFSFEDALTQISAAPDPSALLKKAEAYIQFQCKSLAPAVRSRQARPIADAYFQLGEALYRKEDVTFLDQSLRYYQKALEWYSAVRHGWGFFQAGRIFEYKNQWDKALQAYNHVAEYDFGFLGLQAGYRKALVQNQGGEEADSEAVYRYLRFYGPSVDHARVAQNLADAHFDSQPEAYYVLARLWETQEITIPDGTELTPKLLTSPINEIKHRFASAVHLSKARNDAPKLSTALDQLFFQRFPDDPLAYPSEDWEHIPSFDLFESYYAPRSIKNGGITLLNDGHLLAELLIQPSDPTQKIQIEVEIENPSPSPKTIFFGLGPEGRELQSQVIEETSQTIRVQFDHVHFRDILDVYFQDPNSQDNMSMSWIKIRRLQASRIVENTN